MIHPLRHNYYLQLLKVLLFVLATLLVLIIWSSLTGAMAQEKRFSNQSTAQGETPIYSDYKGVRIGMTMDEVRSKLGEPKELADAQFFYVISDKETAQIFFDQAKKVKAISVDYIGETSTVPGCGAVVGTQVQPLPDGSVYKLVRYPKQGFWVSYNRTAGTTPIITITIQKL